MSILALDQGTSATKAVVVDPVAGPVAVAEEPVRPRYLPGGGVEHDPHALLGSLLTSGRRALEQAGRPVRAVGLANQGETVLAWDPATGEPLSPAIVWQDRRAAAICAELSEHAERIAERTGLVLDPYFSAPKMAWLRRTGTDRGVVTTTDTWLVHQLTGKFVTDAATASRSLLTGLDSAGWDGELLELFGLAGERLPRIVGCDEVVGRTRAFGPAIPVAGLIVDQQAALLAQGCTRPGAAKCTLGTGAFLLANVGERTTPSGTGLTTSVAWRARGRTPRCVDGQVYTAASALDWLRQLGVIERLADLDEIVAEDAGGTLCVPALAGLAAPWWRSDATAAFVGMSLSTRPGHLVLALLEGIAAQVAELVDLVARDLDAPPQRLRVDGGLSRSRAMSQAIADLLRIPVEVYPSPHATALGPAVLARLALEPGLSLEDAVPAWTPARVVEPEWPEHRTREFRERWLATAEATLPPATDRRGSDR